MAKLKNYSVVTLGLILLITSACKKDEHYINTVEIPDFNFPKTITFEHNLSTYGIYQGAVNELVPAIEFQLLELSSVLFTDYSQKQRLIKVPSGTQLTRLADGSIDFPDGTILVKTFYYYHDASDPSLGKRIIESRLLIKESNTWNAATYIWNEAQTDATLELNGSDTQVNWIDQNGTNRSTNYHIPTENECMACHQVNSSIFPIGPSLRNLNRSVERDGNILNQLDHLQSLGILNSFPVNQVTQIVDYNDPLASISERGRAYLDMNCAHCHNPKGWDIPAQVDIDFRYELPVDQTGIIYEKDKISNALTHGKMPFIGTTLKDEEGITLVLQYLESL